MGKNDTPAHDKMLVLGAGVIILLVIAFMVGRISNGAPQTQAAAPTIPPSLQTTTMLSTIVLHNTTELGSNSSSTNNTIVDLLYSKKTVHVPAPTYNLYWNRVVGCYWTDGSYNFSFYAPYAGYLVFNETNSGIPANFSEQYFAVLGVYIVLSYYRDGR